MVQWFISDKENGVNPKGFEEVNDHSLFAEFHVLNDDIWNSIKDGTFRGFSLAGFFEPVKVEMAKQEHPQQDARTELDQIEDLLNQIENKLNKKSNS